MAIALCMVPVSRDDALDIPAVIDHLRHSWSSLPAIDGVSVHQDSASFSVGLARIVLGRVPSPIPLAELKGPCSTATFWPNADIELQDHAAHIIVNVSAELDEIAMATLLTQVTASLVEVTPHGLGVFWRSSAKLIRRDVFAKIVAQQLPTGPPVDIWVDVRVAMDKRKRAFAFTTGMRSLGHAEIEVVSEPVSASDLAQRLIDVAGYLLTHGPVLQDGDCIAHESGETIRIAFCDSVFGHSAAVMQLIYDSTGQ